MRPTPTLAGSMRDGTVSRRKDDVGLWKGLALALPLSCMMWVCASVAVLHILG